MVTLHKSQLIFCFVNGLMINVVKLYKIDTWKKIFFFLLKPRGAVHLMKESDSLQEELRQVVSRKPSSGDYYRHISEAQKDMDSLKVNLIYTSDLSYGFMSLFLWFCTKFALVFIVFSSIIFRLNSKISKHEFIMQ